MGACRQGMDTMMYTAISRRQLPVNSQRPPNAVLMLGHGNRLWTNNKTTLAQCIVLNALSASFEYLCCGSTAIINDYFDFRRQNMTSVDVR